MRPRRSEPSLATLVCPRMRSGRRDRAPAIEHGFGKLNTADCLSRGPDPTFKHTSGSEPGSDLRGRMLAGCWADAWHNNPDNRRVREMREGLSYEETALTTPDDDTVRMIEPKHHPVACMRYEPC